MSEIKVCGDNSSELTDCDFVRVGVNCVKTVLYGKSPSPGQDPKGEGSNIWTNLNLSGSKNTVVALVDTGSNLNLSGCKEDFVQIKTIPTVCITAIDGDIEGGGPVGFVGKLKGNNLGIKYGVYFPPLGDGMRILSGKSIVKAGWKVTLDNTSTSRIEADNKMHPIIWGKDTLPYLIIKFQRDVSGKSGKTEGNETTQ